MKTSPDKYYGNKEFFDNLNKLCRKIRNWENAKINQSNIGKFAEKYMEWYRENISIRVTNITYTRATEAKGAIVFKRYLLSNGMDKTDTVKIDKSLVGGGNIVVSSTITVKPWDEPFLEMVGMRSFSKHDFREKKEKKVRIKLNHYGSTTFECASEMRGFGLDSVKITFEIVAGKTFTQLLNDVFGTEKPDIDAIKGSDDDE